MCSHKSSFSKVMIVLFMVSIYFFSYFQRVAVPGSIFNELQIDFATSASAIAMLGAISFYLYGSIQIFTGFMADTLGAGRILLAGGTVMTVGSIVFPITHSLTLLYISRILVGVGASMVYVSMAKEIDELFGENHFAMVLSVALFLGYTGGLVGTYPLERSIVIIGWRKSFLVAGAMSAIAIIGVAYLLFKTKRLKAGNGSFSWRSIKGVITNRKTIPLIFTSSVYFSLYFLLQAVIGKKLLQDCYGFSSVKAASFTFSMILVNMAVVSMSGFVSRMLGNKRKPIIVFLAFLTVVWTTLIFLILNGMVSSRGLFVCYLLSAISVSGGPVVVSAMKETNHPESIGTAVGLINGASYLVVAIIINIAGIIMDYFRHEAVVTADSIIYPQTAYTVIFSVAVTLALMSFISSFLICETNGRCIYQDNWNGLLESNQECGSTAIKSVCRQRK